MNNDSFLPQTAEIPGEFLFEMKYVSVVPTPPPAPLYQTTALDGYLRLFYIINQSGVVFSRTKSFGFTVLLLWQLLLLLHQMIRLQGS